MVDDEYDYWNPDPVRYFDGRAEWMRRRGLSPGYYWWDETWSNLSERYDTENEARVGLVKYAREVLGVDPPEDYLDDIPATGTD